MKKKADQARRKRHIKKGDKVRVISGNDRGHEGEVLEILTKNDRAIVEGAKMMKKHQKPTANNPNGEIIEKEAGIHMSNLMVIDPSTGEPTKVGRRINENGKLERYSKKSNTSL